MHSRHTSAPPSHRRRRGVRLLASVAVGMGALRTNPLRTALSTLGVIVGVAALVAVLSLGDGMEAYARDQIASTSNVQNVFVIPRQTDEVDGIAVMRDDPYRFETADADAARRVAGVSMVSLAYSGTTLVGGTHDGAERAARVTAALADAAAFYGMDFAAGRYFTAREVDEDAAVAVVSTPLAVAIVGDGEAASAVGRRVRFRDSERTVVGVLAPRGQQDGLAAYVPLPGGAAVMAPNEAARARTLVLRAARVEAVDSVHASAEAWLAARYGPGWAADFTVGTDRGRAEQMSKGILLFKVFMGAIAGISLLVGGIGIMNVLLASVTERTREIGIRKAVGARGREIVLQFLAEAVAITGAGSLLGAAAGVAGAFAVTAGMRAGLEAPVYAGVSASTLLVAALAAIIVGLGFGTYPALRAARLSPIDAIRHE
jgi:putative ABC transport system permease protein